MTVETIAKKWNQNLVRLPAHNSAGVNGKCTHPIHEEERQEQEAPTDLEGRLTQIDPVTFPEEKQICDHLTCPADDDRIYCENR